MSGQGGQDGRAGQGGCPARLVRPVRLVRGFTLVELLVVLVVIGIIVSLSAIGVGSAPLRVDRDSTLASARREAARSGVPVVVETNGQRTRLLPDGREISDRGMSLSQRRGSW